MTLETQVRDSKILRRQGAKASRPRILTRPGGALARLIEVSAAPVIGVAGTGDLSQLSRLLAALLRSGGARVAMGLREALAEAARLRPEDFVVVEISPGLLRQPPKGLELLVLTGLAKDELPAGLELADAVEGLRTLIAGLTGGLVVNADDVRALALAAEARVEVLRASQNDTSAEATVHAGELLLLDPYLGVQRRVCRLEDTRLGAKPFRGDLLLAGTAAAAMGLEVDALRGAMLDFEPGPGRLEPVALRHGLRWISDADASMPGRAARGLAGFADEPVVLIAGGRAGGQPLDRWATIARIAATHVLVFGSAASSLAAAIGCGADGPLVVRCADLEDAIGSATHLARSEQTVLFSPACEPDAIGGVSPAEQFHALVVKGFDGTSAEAA